MKIALGVNRNGRLYRHLLGLKYNIFEFSGMKPMQKIVVFSVAKVDKKKYYRDVRLFALKCRVRLIFKHMNQLKNESEFYVRSSN